ncbi:MAG: hypothetical protein JWO90_2027 [Solirubrobacterales bacterium]|nr:hypothetical protein [Solirubrobacterales bacterium]
MSHDRFEIEALARGRRVVIRLRGELDHYTADRARAVIGEVVRSGSDAVVLDLSGLDFMDAGGIHLLEELRDGVHGDATFSMIGGEGPVALALGLLPDRILPSADVGG